MKFSSNLFQNMLLAQVIKQTTWSKIQNSVPGHKWVDWSIILFLQTLLARMGSMAHFSQWSIFLNLCENSKSYTALDFKTDIWYSKIPWYPKLSFQRENALASFWVQMVLVTQPRPSQEMIKHNFLLRGILELKLNPRRRVYVEIPKPSRVSLKSRQNPRLTPWVLTTF
jgi:hypothetical protein